MSEEITKDTIITDLLRKKPEAAGVLLSKGMHCLGCAIAINETLKEAAEVHGFKVEELLDEINKI